MAKKTTKGIFASAALVACMALPGLAFASNENASIGDELNPANAQIESVNYPFESTCLPDTVKVSVKNTIARDGTDYKLYPTFDDKSKAIEEVSKKCADRLSILSSSYFLPPLDESNWETYFDCMMKFYDDARCPDWYQESDQEESTLQYFFSIMQNDGLNQQIIDAFDNAKVECASLEADSDEVEEASEEVSDLLPDQEMLEESLEDDETENGTILVS